MSFIGVVLSLQSQHEIKIDFIYSLIHVPGLIVHDSLIYVISNTKYCLLKYCPHQNVMTC